MNDPAGWRTGSLASVADYFSDGDWIETPFITDEGIRLIQTGNVGVGKYLDKPDTRKYVSEETFRSLGCKEVRPQDLLICRLADPVGRACVIPEHVGPAITAVDCTIVRLDESRAERAFLRHWMSTSSWLTACERVAAGTTRTRISRANLGALEVPLPPVEEQRRIAEILDTIDEAIQATEHIIAKLQARHVGLMSSIIDHAVRDASTVACASVLRFQSGITLNPSRAPRVNPIGYLRVANVHRDAVRLDDIAALEATPAERSSLGLQAGDLLVVEGHANPEEIGRCAMVPDAAAGLLFQNHLFRLRPGNIVGGFALEMLNSHVARTYWRRVCATSSGLYTINSRQLANLPMPVVPVEVQERVARVAAVSKALISTERARLRKLCSARNGLASDLLSGRVRTVAL